MVIITNSITSITKASSPKVIKGMVITAAITTPLGHGATYDLRWLDAMNQHHTGALRMSEYVFGIGALGLPIWPTASGAIRPLKSRP